MSKFVKTAIAAAMVMGVFTSTATIAAGNNGTARFYSGLHDSGECHSAIRRYHRL